MNFGLEIPFGYVYVREVTNTSESPEESRVVRDRRVDLKRNTQKSPDPLPLPNHTKRSNEQETAYRPKSVCLPDDLQDSNV